VTRNDTVVNRGTGDFRSAWYINWHDGSKDGDHEATWEQASDVLFELLDQERNHVEA
jgi:hypothetical protein